ncbi:NAD(P)/FAD-dependent oxidoreductase [Rhizobium alvei]
MPPADSALFSIGQSTADVLVVGGGIMGLWAAVKAVQTGLTVTIVDRHRIGSGASGGLLGALFPWMPNNWDKKKQFQFDALTALAEELAPLEAETGLSARYRQSGRIIPLPKPHLRTIAERHQQDALVNWNQPSGRFFWHVGDVPPIADYVAPDLATAGYVEDTLAARANPRALTGLLRTWLQAQRQASILEQCELIRIDAKAGSALLKNSDGKETTLLFAQAVLAAGVESFPILETLLPPLPKPLGQGVKGQAALLAADLDPALPVVFLDGVYIVPHTGGRVAVGSTSENSYDDPETTDTGLDRVVERARQLIPALRGAPVVERWAGIRPKAIGRDPMIGPVPGHSNIHAMTGGFKISFGVAHRLAERVIDSLCGRGLGDLPESFTMEGHLVEMEKDL